MNTSLPPRLASLQAVVRRPASGTLLPCCAPLPQSREGELLIPWPLHRAELPAGRRDRVAAGGDRAVSHFQSRAFRVGARLDREHLVTEGTQKDSTYPAFIVALHVATAVALLVFYARDWVVIIGGLVTVLRTRPVQTSTQRLAVLISIATIPVGILGLALETTLRSVPPHRKRRRSSSLSTA